MKRSARIKCTAAAAAEQKSQQQQAEMALFRQEIKRIDQACNKVTAEVNFGDQIQHCQVGVLLSVNTATQSELADVLSNSMATTLVTFRPFQSAVDAIERVPGFGANKVHKLQAANIVFAADGLQKQAKARAPAPAKAAKRTVSKVRISANVAAAVTLTKSQAQALLELESSRQVCIKLKQKARTKKLGGVAAQKLHVAENRWMQQQVLESIFTPEELALESTRRQKRRIAHREWSRKKRVVLVIAKAIADN